MASPDGIDRAYEAGVTMGRILYSKRQAMAHRNSGHGVS